MTLPALQMLPVLLVLHFSTSPWTMWCDRSCKTWPSMGPREMVSWWIATNLKSNIISCHSCRISSHHNIISCNFVQPWSNANTNANLSVDSCWNWYLWTNAWMHSAEFEVMAAQNGNSILSFRFVSDQWMSWFTPKESLSASQDRSWHTEYRMHYYEYRIQFWIHIKSQSLKKRISKIYVGLRKEHLDVLMPGTSHGVTGNVAAAPDLPAFSVGDARTTCPLVPPNPKEEIEAVAWCRKKGILFTNIDVHDSEPKMHANAKNIKLNWFASGSSIHISIIIHPFPYNLCLFQSSSSSPPCTELHLLRRWQRSLCNPAMHHLLSRSV